MRGWVGGCEQEGRRAEEWNGGRTAWQRERRKGQAGGRLAGYKGKGFRREMMPELFRSAGSGTETTRGDAGKRLRADAAC